MKKIKYFIAIILLLSSLVQTVTYLFNYISKKIVFESFCNTAFRFSIDTVITAILLIAAIVPNYYIVKKYDSLIKWKDHFIKRFVIEFLITIFTGVLFSVIVNIIANFLSPVSGNFYYNLTYNTIITIFINIILVCIIEAILFFDESEKNFTRIERLENEFNLIELETLKNQLDPHFLFNSLNTLSGLIKISPDKSEKFIEEFAKIYRYVLDTIDKKAIPLRSELEFARSYLYLMSIRFKDEIVTEIIIREDINDDLIIPLALQITLENIFKHNKISIEEPIKIRIYSLDDYLVVENNFNPKISTENSNKIGHQNLKRRYEHIFNKTPLFYRENCTYITKLPLVKTE